MKKKNSYLKLCLDPELEKESQKVKKRAIIFSIAFSSLAVIAVGSLLFFLLRF